MVTYVARYDRRDIEELMPAVWDETYAYGMPEREGAPDKDLPKGSTNKAHGNSHWAFIADIKTGWQNTRLTHKERVAAVLHYGMGWTHADIALNQACDRSTITHRLESVVGKIMRHLNGAEYEEDEPLD